MVASISIDAMSVDIGAIIYPDCDGQPMSDNTKTIQNSFDRPHTLDKKSL
jgi:hypothetical protein